MSEPQTLWKWIVTKAEVRADKLILAALGEHLGEWTGEPRALSRSQLHRLIEEGRVTANGQPLISNSKPSSGTEIRISFPPARSLDLIPENRPLEILYEDPHLLVLNKPQGLTVHPSTTQTEGTLVHALLHHIKDLSGIGGILRPGIVHRIDKNTSGAIVITKTDEAHRGLAEIFAKHDLERRYWAICYGNPGSRKIESLIGRNPADRKKMSMQVTSGRKAVTHIRTLRAFGTPQKSPFASLVEATLETGRTHQVRVHLAGVHHSIMGDPTYGTPTKNQPKWTALPAAIQDKVALLPGQALHARVLGFEHPVTGEKLRFEAEPPLAFQELLSALEKYG